MATAIRQSAVKEPAEPVPGGYGSATDFRAVIETALSALDSDERSGPLVRATGMRMRLSLPDISTVLNIAAEAGRGEHLRWAFTDAGDWKPKLRLELDSGVANRFLQGRESLAIAIARGRVRIDGEPRYTLLYVPALRALVEPYRRAVRRLCPELALD